MIITISGTPGSGKSSVAKILAEKLNYKRYYMGQIARDIAKRKGMTLTEGLQSGEADPSFVEEIDAAQKDLGKKEDNFVIEGRTSYFFIPNSVKVFIKVDPLVGAKRIFNDLKKNQDRNEGHFTSPEEVLEDNKKRMETDTKRYKKYYDQDVFNEDNYDLVIDTTNRDQFAAADKILDFVKKFK